MRLYTGNGRAANELRGFFFCNWLAGSLSGLKSPIFRHTSRFFLTIALLWPAKNPFVWRKMDPFLAQTRPANQLRYVLTPGAKGMKKRDIYVVFLENK
jgi:hypothetical protein